MILHGAELYYYYEALKGMRMSIGQWMSSELLGFAFVRMLSYKVAPSPSNGVLSNMTDPSCIMASCSVGYYRTVSLAPSPFNGMFSNMAESRVLLRHAMSESIVQNLHVIDQELNSLRFLFPPAFTETFFVFHLVSSMPAPRPA